MNRAISDLNKTWYYRLLKVLFVISFLATIFLAIMFGYEEIYETWGTMENDSNGFLIYLIIALPLIWLLFEGIKSMFYYIVLGKFFPSKDDNK